MSPASSKREDLLYAAYALALGFTIDPGRVYVAEDFVNGIPKDTLHFTIGEQNVWYTARGWRVARLDPATDRYDAPNVFQDFKNSLLNSLNEAFSRHVAQKGRVT